MRRRPTTSYSPTRDVATPTTRWVGRTLGPYRVRSVLEHDAESVTLLVDERKNDADRRVILRCLERGAEDDPSTRARFEREARICLALRHVNLVGGLGRPIIDGQPALALEYDDGRRWSDVLRQTRIQRVRVPPPVAVMVASRAAGGLDHAHRLTDLDTGTPVLHRALRPSCLFVTPKGWVRLAGFGREPRPSSRGALIETLRYLAPEQVCGEQASPATDVYALGAVLAETLAGRPLFGGQEPKTLLADIVRGRRPSMAEWLDFQATALEETLERALSLAPDDRYPTAAAFGWALERALAQLGDLAAEEDLAAFVATLKKSTADLPPMPGSGRSRPQSGPRRPPSSPGEPRSDPSRGASSPPTELVAAAPVPEVRPPIDHVPRAATPLEPETFSTPRPGRRGPPPAPPGDPILQVANRALGPERPASGLEARVWTHAGPGPRRVRRWVLALFGLGVTAAIAGLALVG